MAIRCALPTTTDQLKRRAPLIGGVAALVSGVDLLTKTVAMKTPTSGAPSWILGHVVGLDRVNHPGAWNGSDLVAALAGALFVLCLVLAAMQWLSRRQEAWVAVLGGVVLGGLIGNNVDRVSEGLVTDWLLIRLTDTGNVVVNLADVAIAVGGVLAMTVVAWGLCLRLWSSAPPRAIQTRAPHRHQPARAEAVTPLTSAVTWVTNTPKRTVRRSEPPVRHASHSGNGVALRPTVRHAASLDLQQPRSSNRGRGTCSHRCAQSGRADAPGRQPDGGGPGVRHASVT